MSRRKKNQPRGLQRKEGRGGARELAWYWVSVYEQSKTHWRGKRDPVVRENGQSEFIRTRPEELDGETIPRNFIGQPISGIIGNRWKSSFADCSCLLLASLDWVLWVFFSFHVSLSFSFSRWYYTRFHGSRVCERVHTKRTGLWLS